mmetsp:Transcript_112593/g.313023  ORF Transcript_112593/g.313023 Transcript_112593/m.313023 type:complete len:286 (+) Transcript_112593:2-859(+)
MNRRGAYLWGLSTTSNAKFMQSSGARGEVQDHLGLVYGAFFGFICRHEPMLYTRLGQVKDDLERTLRYWDRDRIVLRFCHYACRKRDRPGKFATNKGGISLLGATAHRAEADEALGQMALGFAWKYVRLPTLEADCFRDAITGEAKRRPDGSPCWKFHVSDTGVVFRASGTSLEKAAARPDCTLEVGFTCRSCRSRGNKRKAAAACAACVRPLECEALNEFSQKRAESSQNTSKKDLAQMWRKLGLKERERIEDLAARRLCDSQWKKRPLREDDAAEKPPRKRQR